MADTGEKLVRVSEAKAKLMAVHNWFGGPVQTEQDKLAQAVVKMCIEEIDKLEPAKEVAQLEEKIVELEGQVVRMQCYDDNITQKRVFEIAFSDLLEPVEAMDIFIRNVKRIFGRENEHEKT